MKVQKYSKNLILWLFSVTNQLIVLGVATAFTYNYWSKKLNENGYWDKWLIKTLLSFKQECHHIRWSLCKEDLRQTFGGATLATGDRCRHHWGGEGRLAGVQRRAEALRRPRRRRPRRWPRRRRRPGAFAAVASAARCRRFWNGGKKSSSFIQVWTVFRSWPHELLNWKDLK